MNLLVEYKVSLRRSDESGVLKDTSVCLLGIEGRERRGGKEVWGEEPSSRLAKKR